MSDWPWDVLGLESEAASEREVKRAYARLLKKHRPDDDPEGFRRLQDAYEAARAMVENAALIQEEAKLIEDAFEQEADESEVLPVTGSEPDRGFGAEQEQPTMAITLPEAWYELVREFEGCSDDDARALILPKFNELARTNPLCLAAWGELVQRGVQQNPALLNRCVGEQEILFELRSGSSTASLAMLEYWAESNEWDKIRKLGERIHQRATHYAHPHTGHFLYRLAVLLVFLNGQHSTNLASFAYEQLPVRERDGLVGRIDHFLQVGKLFEYKDASLKEWLASRFFVIGNAEPWTDEESTKKLIQIARQYDVNRNERFQMVEPFFPPQTWKELKQQSAQARPVHVEPAKGHSSHGEKKSKSRNLGCLWFFIAYACIKVATMVWDDSPDIQVERLQEYRNNLRQRSVSDDSVQSLVFENGKVKLENTSFLSNEQQSDLNGYLKLEGSHASGEAAGSQSYFDKQRMLAKAGSTTSMYQLALLYEAGEAVAEDRKQARHWFEQAAVRGHAEATERYAFYCEHGLGGEQDPPKAFELYRKLADRGHADGHLRLADCYRAGTGTAQNRELAALHYEKASGLGRHEANFKLGRCYYEGFGKVRNESLGLSLIRKAAEAGHKSAIAYLEQGVSGN